MFKKILLLLIFQLGITGYCQVFIPEVPKITVADLSQKVHPQDTMAAAAYLYRNGQTWFEIKDNQWVVVTEIYTRLKIYKKEGYSYANAEINFYTGSNKANTSFTDANTYNLVGTTLEKTVLKKDGEFEKVMSENVSQKKITLPNVRVGSIIEYKYTIRMPFSGYFRDYPFQFDIPANNVRYDVWIPVYFSYNMYIMGYVNIDQTLAQTVYNSKTDSNERYYTYKATNVKAIKGEEYVNNIENYTSILKHELATVQFTNSRPEHYATDWKAVAKKIYEDDKFGPELRQTSYFDAELKPVIAAITDETAKATAILDFVKDRMAWNKDNDYLCTAGVKKAYTAKVGNTAEINLMLTAMLRSAGLDANPVLVSTRANGIAIYPARNAYNYVIASVKINNKTILLDATSKYSRPDIIPIRALNWQGRLIKKNGETEEVDLLPRTNSKEIINILANINADGTVSGKVRDQYQDYTAYTFREAYAESEQESYLEKMEARYNGIAINDYKITNQKDLAKPVIEEYAFTHNLLADVIANKIYINPMLFFSNHTNPFKQDKREYPVDFVYPHQDKYLITLNIPAGYVIESLPAALSVAMNENIGGFKYNLMVSGNTIQVSAVFDINYASVSQDYYQSLKDFYQKMIDCQNEKIVLKKA